MSVLATSQPAPSGASHSSEELIRRWRALIDDPTAGAIVGKVDLDHHGRMIVSPVNFTHGRLAARLVLLLNNQLGGHCVLEVGVLVSTGVFAPDVAWCSDSFRRAHENEVPLMLAPELCIEIASPSNGKESLLAKSAAYLAAGATECWLVFPGNRNVEFYGRSGPLSESSFHVDLSTLFD